jgi:nitroreductase
MDIWEAIRGRRSVGRVSAEPVAREEIERVLEAANWAPSHHGTEPWRFFVMTGAGRDVLARAYGEVAVQEAEGTLDEGAAAALRAKHEPKAYRAPVVIAVAVSPSADPKVIAAEEYAAAHAAVQNMLLAVHASGLAAIWRSGEPMYHPAMARAFGLAEGEMLVGLLYIGHPEAPLHEGRRRPAAEKTVWLTGE